MRKLDWLMLGTALFSPAGVAAQATDPGPSRIEASGNASVSVRPTLATITFTMSATHSSASTAGQKVAATADSLRAALTALGIPRDSLISGSRWRWWRGRLEMRVSQPYCANPSALCTRQDLRQDTTYTVQDRVEAHISNFDVIGRVIDEALRLGITEMTDVGFSAPSRAEAEDRALAEATARARHRAEIMAETLGSALGRLQVMSTEASYPRGYRDWLAVVPQSAGYSAGYSAGRTEVIVPSLTISVTVYGTWELNHHGPGE